MRKWLTAVVIVSLCGGISGCARTSVYSDWADRLSKFNLQDGGRVEDVSRVVGNAPMRCEALENQRPFVGMVWDRTKEPAVIIHVRQDSPAYRAGIRTGDIIRAVGGEPVANPAQVLAAFAKNVKEGQAFTIQTNRATVSVTPVRQKAERCYWEAKPLLEADPQTTAASFNMRGGQYSSRMGASAEGSAGPRYFRTTCRIFDGFVAGCESNWKD